MLDKHAFIVNFEYNFQHPVHVKEMYLNLKIADFKIVTHYECLKSPSLFTACEIAGFSLERKKKKTLCPVLNL